MRGHDRPCGYGRLRVVSQDDVGYALGERHEGCVRFHHRQQARAQRLDQGNAETLVHARADEQARTRDDLRNLRIARPDMQSHPGFEAARGNLRGEPFARPVEFAADQIQREIRIALAELDHRVEQSIGLLVE